METKLNRENIVAEIMDYFEENPDDFADALEAMDSYDGYLGDDRFYGMDEINELYQNPLDAMQRAFFGHDGECYTIDDRGEKHYGEFNPMREYFCFNGYGNFVSYDTRDYSDYLCENTIDDMLNSKYELDYALTDRVKELFRALEWCDDDACETEAEE